MPHQTKPTQEEVSLSQTWVAVDKYTTAHVHPASRPNHDILEQTLSNCDKHDIPRIASSRPWAKFLALQCMAGRFTHALEVGTLGGYAAIWIATMCPDIKVTTLELDPRHAEVAKENVSTAGMSDRIEVLVGPALETLPKLKQEIEQGKRSPFGFTFVDADKLNNWNYFDAAVDMSVPGAVLVVDNLVYGGMLVDPQQQANFRVIGARAVIENAGRDPRVEAVVLQTIGNDRYDGILYATVKR